MTERPILFSPPMVQAILDGRKLQTRRSLSDKLIINVEPDRYGNVGFDDDHNACFEDLKPEITPWISPIKCPYGKPGDILWVRESFAKLVEKYKDGTLLYQPQGFKYVYKADGVFMKKWKPSIHMPKKAARIWLEVTDVRVERLQDISEEDAVLEGVEWDHPFARPEDCSDLVRSHHWINCFMVLWQSINGPESWKLNPWVWVVSFKVLSTTGKAGIERKEAVV